MEWSSSPPRTGSDYLKSSSPFPSNDMTLRNTNVFTTPRREISVLHSPQDYTHNVNSEYRSILQKMHEVGLPTSVSAICHEEPPQIANSYLEAAGRILGARDYRQTAEYPKTHEDRSRNLAGIFANIGSEQHPESLKDFVDKKRRENLDALIESEDSVRVEAKRLRDFLVPDLEWERFKEEAMLSYAAAGSGGVVEMLRNQRLRTSKVISLGDRQLTNEERMYARTLRECNEDLLCSRPATVNMADKFSAVVVSTHDKTSCRLWEAFVAVLNFATERQSSPAHIVSFRTSEDFSKELIAQARKYLEQSAYQLALDRIQSPVRDLDSQSIEVSNAVIPYTRIQLSKSRIKMEFSGTKLHGLPIWALVFNALRLGAIKTAISFCNQGDESTKNFVRYLTEYSRNNGSLLASSQRELQTAYFSQSSTASPDDVYKRAVYAVVSRAEPHQDFSEVTFSVGDWLWMKLAQTDPVSTGNREEFTLTQLQEVVRSRFPEGKTDEIEAFLAFVLTGQFEYGLDRLFQSFKYRIHSVHMGIVLKCSHLLLISTESSTGAILVEKPPLSFLDFATMIRSYVGEFQKSNVDIAMEYYYHLSDTPAVRSSLYQHVFRNLFEFCVYKLAKDSTSYAELFGRIDAGSFQRGLVFKFIEDPSAIMEAVADDFVQDGRLEDAITLYEISGKKKALYRTLLRVLSDDLIVPTSSERREKLRKIAVGCAERFKSAGSEEDIIVRNFFIILDLATFFGFVDDQQNKKALLAMQKIKLVPLESTMVESTLVAYQEDLLPEVRECIPQTVLRTMQALVSCYMDEKERILGSRMGAEVAAPLKTANLMVSGARLSDDLIKVQNGYRQQSRTVLEFASRIPAAQLPHLMDLLVKMDSQIS